MKPWMKVLMWFGLGAGIGFFAGMQVGQRKAEEAKPDDEPEDAEILSKEFCKAMEEYGAYISYVDSHSYDNVENFVTVEGLNRILRKPATDDEDPDMPKEEDLLIDPDIPQLHPQHFVPEIIGEEEFNLNVWHYDIENLLFYSMDEVLYNETTQTVIENPDEVIGIGTLFEFGGDPNNPVYTIYVKNETYGTLFRIESIDAAFCDAVDGTMGPDDDDGEEDFKKDDFWDDV